MRNWFTLAVLLLLVVCQPTLVSAKRKKSRKRKTDEAKRLRKEKLNKAEKAKKAKKEEAAAEAEKKYKPKEYGVCSKDIKQEFCHPKEKSSDHGAMNGSPLHVLELTGECDSVLHQLFGNETANNFFKEFYENQTVKSKRRTRFIKPLLDDPVVLDDLLLNTLSDEEQLGHVNIYRNGVPVMMDLSEAPDVQERYEVIKKQRVRKKKGGSTLIITQAQRFHQGLLKLTQSLHKLTDLFVSATVQHAHPEAMPFPPKYDKFHSIIVQLDGRRTWGLCYPKHNQLNDFRALHDDEDKVSVQQSKDAFQERIKKGQCYEVELVKGDVMYIPAGLFYLSFTEKKESTHVQFALDQTHSTWHNIFYKALEIIATKDNVTDDVVSYAEPLQKTLVELDRVFEKNIKKGLKKIVLEIDKKNIQKAMQHQEFDMDEDWDNYEYEDEDTNSEEEDEDETKMSIVLVHRHIAALFRHTCPVWAVDNTGFKHIQDRFVNHMRELLALLLMACQFERHDHCIDGAEDEEEHANVMAELSSELVNEAHRFLISSRKAFADYTEKNMPIDEDVFNGFPNGGDCLDADNDIDYDVSGNDDAYEEDIEAEDYIDESMA